MLNKTKKYWFLILTAILAALLLFLWIQTRVAQKEPGIISTPLPSLPEITFPNIGEKIQIDKNMVQLNIPPGLGTNSTTLYQVSPISVTPEQTSLIASKLGLPEKPSLINNDIGGKQKYIWIKNASTLSIQLSPLEIKLVTEEFFATPPTVGNFLSPQDYLSYLKNLLLSTLPQQIGVDYAIDTTLESRGGKTFEVHLSPKVKNNAVVDISTRSLVIAELQKDNKLFSFSFYAGFSSPVKAGSYPTKNNKDVEKNIIREGRIVLLGEPSESPKELMSSVITINSTEEALLFVPEKLDLLYPIYVLKGSATTQEGELPITIYIPAVKSEYLIFTP